MNRTNKKGFTIVELVVVIAVIAILAAVLIPNLSRLVEKANESKAMQEAKAAYEAYLVDHAEDMDKIDLCIKSDGHYYHVTAGQFSAEEVKDHKSCALTNATAMKVVNGALSPEASTTKPADGE